MRTKLHWMGKTIFAISSAEALRVMDSREPRERFVVLRPTAAVSIDNRTGDAWTEELSITRAALRWLAGCGLNDREGGKMCGTPLPFHDWHDVKVALASGQQVYEVTATQTASVLIIARDEEAAMIAAGETPDEYYRQHTPWMVTDCDVVLPDDA